MFGLKYSSIQGWVDYGMEVLIKVLKDKTNDQLNVKWPEEASMKASSGKLVHKRPNGRLMKGILPSWKAGASHAPNMTTKTCIKLTSKDKPAKLR